MGSLHFETFVTADVTLTTTAEATVATLAGVGTNKPGQTLSFLGSVTLTTGAATTAVTLRVRQDSLTGTVVGEAVADAVEAAAGSVETHTIYVANTAPGEFSGRTYVLTAQQTAATGNGTVSQAAFAADARP